MLFSLLSSFFMMAGSREQCTLVKFSFLLGKNATEAVFTAAYKDEEVNEWCSQMSIDIKPHSGRQKLSQQRKMLMKFQNLSSHTVAEPLRNFGRKVEYLGAQYIEFILMICHIYASKSQRQSNVMLKHIKLGMNSFKLSDFLSKVILGNEHSAMATTKKQTNNQTPISCSISCLI